MDKRLKKIILDHRSGDELSRALEQHQDRLRAISRKLTNMPALGLKARILANICTATARQLKIIQSNIENPTEVLASACRMTFELNLQLRYVQLAEENLEDFTKRRGTEEIELLNGVLKLSDEQTPPNTRKTLEQRINHIEMQLDKYGGQRPPKRATHVREMADAVGLTDEYLALYGFYSKYVHASSWLVNGPKQHTDDELFRELFVIKSQLYAGSTCAQAEELAGSGGASQPAE